MRPTDHPPVATGKIGVLLVNLGSPDAPTADAVRRYLDQFLSDRRVVELPPFLWQPILKGFVLTTRPRKSAAAYAAIWDREGNDSPLRLITRQQSEALQGAFGPDVIVDFAMRYGSPAMDERLLAMKNAGCERILLAPLYPQYSSATTGSVLEEGFRILSTRRWMPATATLAPYFDHPAHIAALARSVQSSLAALPFEPELLFLSFHGMPERTLELGDPYHCQCQKTARLLREALQWPEQRVMVGFQSLFGRAEWLKPYTLPTLLKLAEGGLKRVAVVCPGFSADCLETLEEIAIEARDEFLAAGGTDFAYLPCLNSSPDGMDMLRVIVGEALAGWLAKG